RLTKWHIELVGLVAAVRLTLAEIPVDPGRTKHRTGDAQRQKVLSRDAADADRSLAPDGVPREELLVLVEPAGQEVQELPDPLVRAFRQVHGQAAHPDVGVVHA